METVICPKCNSENIIFSRKRQINECEDCGYSFTVEKPFIPLRIFLSYGRDEYSDLADKLKSDLIARGHKVWFDKDRLKEGGDWDQYIEDGLRWACSDLATGRIVIVMTPHSVRRPDGYCLNEIAMAITKKVDIVPVMLVFCEPPLSIYRLQYLDMQEVWPPDVHPGPYESKFARLLSALEDRNIDFEGTQSAILSALQPIEFRADILKLLEGFTGRNWVFDAFDKWVHDPAAKQIFWVTGAPGVGKSAIAAWLRENRREIAAFHFCDSFSEEKRDPAKLVASIACQLATQLPVYQERLARLDLAEIITDYKEAYTLFDKLIVQPMSDMETPDRMVVVLIDALDEATVKGANQIVTFISQSFPKAPSWLRLCITSRPETEIISVLQKLNPFVLDTKRTENLEDIRSFLINYPLKSGQVLPEAAIDTIILRSDGLFLYVKHVCEGINDGELSADKPEDFPLGLSEVYHKFFNRKFENSLDRYKSSVRPLLAMMCASFEPLTVGFLMKVLGKDKQELSDILDLMGSLCTLSGETKADSVRFFHRSLKDWLTVKAKAGNYYADIEPGHIRLAEFGWEDYQAGPGNMDGYSLRWLPRHLVETEEWQKIESVLCDIFFVESRAKARLLDGLQGDFEEALKVFPEGEGREYVDGFFTLFMRQKHVLVRHPVVTFQQLYNELQWEKGMAKKILENARWKFVEKGGCFLHQHRIPKLEKSHLLMTLDGHGQDVNSCSYSPDGRRIVSAWQDNSLRIWDAETGKEISTLKGHSGFVKSCSYSPDGLRIVSASWDKTLKVWDAGTGKEISTLKGHGRVVESCSYSPDGRRIVSAGWEKTLKIWDAETGKEIFTLTGHSSSVKSCSYSPDGRRIVSASLDKSLKIWDAGTGKEIFTLTGHSHIVNSCSFSPDGRRIISASYDKTLKIWDAETGKEISALIGHSGTVESCSYSPDSRHIVSAGADRTLKIWDAETGKEISTLTGHSGIVESCSYSPDSRHIVSAGVDHTLKIWDAKQGKEISTLTGHRFQVFSCSYSPDGRRIVTASLDSTLKIWDAETGKEISTLAGHRRPVLVCSYSPDGRHIVSASKDNTLKIWDAETGKVVSTLTGHSGQVSTCSYSPDGRRIVSASRDETLKIWDAETGKEISTLTGHSGWLKACSYSPDGRRIVSLGRDNTLNIWDAEAGNKVSTLTGHIGEVVSCLYSPDGRRIVSASRDKTLRIWDAETGIEISTLAGHSGSVTACSYSPDGRRIVSASWDKSLKIWDADTGKVISTLTGHSGSVDICAYSPDGGRIVSASQDKTLIFWDAETGKEMARFYCEGGVYALAISPCGEKNACGDSGGNVYFLKPVGFANI